MPVGRQLALEERCLQVRFLGLRRDGPNRGQPRGLLRRDGDLSGPGDSPRELGLQVEEVGHGGVVGVTPEHLFRISANELNVHLHAIAVCSHGRLHNGIHAEPLCDCRRRLIGACVLRGGQRRDHAKGGYSGQFADHAMVHPGEDVLLRWRFGNVLERQDDEGLDAGDRGRWFFGRPPADTERRCAGHHRRQGEPRACERQPAAPIQWMALCGPLRRGARLDRLERRVHFARPLVATLGLFLQTAADDGAQSERHGLRQRRGRLVQDGRAQLEACPRLKRPHARRHLMEHHAQRPHVAASARSPCNCSGAMYGNVPTRAPTCVNDSRAAVVASARSSPLVRFANPKSRTLARPCGVTRVFPVFKSR